MHDQVLLLKHMSHLAMYTVAAVTFSLDGHVVIADFLSSITPKQGSRALNGSTAMTACHVSVEDKGSGVTFIKYPWSNFQF